MSAHEERLFELLPALYRARDAERNHELKALLAIAGEELERIEEDVERLADDWFIETCQEWVVPYIGDLLGVRGLLPVRAAPVSQRGRVANTIAYRRRKGTAAVLEQLARDTTGWPARVVEFFERLATTQHLNHVRLHAPGTVSLSDVNALERIEGAFSRAAHTGEVRHVDNGRGRFNIPNVGLFVWRLQDYRIFRGSARQLPALKASLAGRLFSFSPLGHDAPLFNTPRTEQGVELLAGEENVPAPLRRRALHDELEATRAALAAGALPPDGYFGDQPAFRIYLDGGEVPLRPDELLICDLREWRLPRAGIRAAVDPVLGRIAVGGDVPERVEVAYAYGFSADLGGGPYERARSRVLRTTGGARPDTVAEPDALDVLLRVPTDHATIGAAIAAWDRVASPRAVVQVEDSLTRAEDLVIDVTDAELTLQAANQRRPTLLGDITVTGGGAPSRLAIEGFLVAGRVEVIRDLQELAISHCTLVPGRRLATDGQPKEPDRASVLAATSNHRLRVAIDYSITGPLRLPPDAIALRIRDSIVDAPPAGRLPALVSGHLAPFPSWTADEAKVRIAIGSEGPFTLDLGAVPSDIEDARSRLEAAIRAAHDSPAYTAARVLSVGNRLVVVSGSAGAGPVIRQAPGDETGARLELSVHWARRIHAFASGSLDPFPSLDAAQPRLTVTIDEVGPLPITLSARPTTLAAAAKRLQAAIRKAGPTTLPFRKALVTVSGDRLLVVPGTHGRSIAFGPAEDDPHTARTLALTADRPAIAGSDGEDVPGPPTEIERCTIFGRVRVRQLTLASDTLFGAPVLADRRQEGCARYSYLPDGSRTPRRFRCQPDLAVQQAQSIARRADPAITDAALEELARQVRGRVVPHFTRVRYGTPAYAQLGRATPEEILAGAEDEGEMGAFNFLQNTQRLTNLRESLDEYLRFGLEAGIFFAT
jgi:hypothetical protein